MGGNDYMMDGQCSLAVGQLPLLVIGVINTLQT